MNERLKELYRQAHSVRHYDGHPSLDGNPPTVYWQDEVSAGRFAELIVKECLVQIGDAIPDTNCSAAAAYKTAKLAATSRVKEHFGVEQ